MKRRVHTKKVLVAAIGIATVSYAAACLSGGTESSGNLLPPPDAASDGTSKDGNADVATSGNLLPPPDTGVDTGADVSTSGNLVPPPQDAGDDGG